MKVNKKKVIVLVSLVVLLAGVACLNYFLTVKGIGKSNGTTTTVTNNAEPTFFSTYRSDRDSTRTQEKLYLESIMASTSADEATVAEANKTYLSLTGTMETETVLEGLIKAYGFNDCIVTISNGNVNVVVHDAELTVEEAAQILSTIVSETEYTAKDVVIIPYV